MGFGKHESGSCPEQRIVVCDFSQTLNGPLRSLNMVKDRSSLLWGNCLAESLSALQNSRDVPLSEIYFAKHVFIICLLSGYFKAAVY